MQRADGRPALNSPPFVISERELRKDLLRDSVNSDYLVMYIGSNQRQAKTGHASCQIPRINSAT